ncbi:hypothetical protein KPB05_24985 [Burkholderia gladioli]|uniref:hypothetical protein n=1 Tax=Burkholderia gladioli TaxID=28095 RepID=UPI0028547CC6|nr:hypothetical protein [Burkholderia gladioli]MDR8090710.1 hypothetical protein [Burkholderia gladioli]
MSTVEDKKSDDMRLRDWPWPVIASAIGLLLLGIAYSSGDAYYKAFLGQFWIEAEAFPIDKSRHIILSVWGGLNAAVGVENWFGKNWGHVLMIMLGLLVYIAMCVLLEKGAKWLGSRLRARKDGTPRSYKVYPLMARYLYFVFWLLLTVIMVVGLSWWIPTTLAIPSSIGEVVGQSIAVDFKRDLDKGCGKSKERCQILIKNGQEVARGYVIVQSPTRIAVYYDGNTRQIPMDGIEMRTADRSLTR